MLEGLHDSEAKLVLSVKAKKMPGISHEVAHRAFPNVVPAPIVEEKPPSAPKKKATRRKTKN